MHQHIVDTLKAQYSRDLRKQIVKSIIKSEKNDDKLTKKSSYKIINQIFSYIISELNWSIANSTSNWDDTPHKLLCEVFPKIETTQWFKNQKIDVSKAINLKGDFN